ncbi:MAG: 5-oxoprolinase subunit PxpB [Colwelliaceae bacterium]|nr:5-oxoprolinase subunit PxpB [Colwelliaceae bacterium]
MNQFEITPSSEDSVLITWPEKICPIQHNSIIEILKMVKEQLNDVIFESIVSYNSLMLYYHFDQITYLQLKQRIANCIIHFQYPQNLPINDTSTIEIPVYYGTDAGWDLNAVAKQCHLTCDQVIEKHSQQVYRAYALGFTPGFCYLGTLDKKINLPRRSTPRIIVPKGAVAIAEAQTAVYPNKSPGGWHIIGQTPTPLYKKSNDKFNPIIRVGQQIRFTSIDRASYIKMAGCEPINECDI